MLIFSSSPRGRWAAFCTFIALGLLSACQSADVGTGGDAGDMASGPADAGRTLPAQVFVIDDGERIGPQGMPSGQDNPVWAPGQPVRLIGLPGETVALQVVVTATAAALDGVTVELPGLHGPADIAGTQPPAGGHPTGLQAPPPFRAIERFVAFDLDVTRRSGGSTDGVSLGWSRGAIPDDASNTGLLPEPLIPVEVAPPWADYPMTVPLGQRRVVWIDVTLPAAGLPAGLYQGSIVVQARDPQGGGAASVATLPVELQVGPAALPYAAARTMVFYDPTEIRGRTGSDNAIRHYLQLMHRHQMMTISSVETAADVTAQAGELSGALFDQAHGYDGPGAGGGIDVISIGTYGSLKDPTAAKVTQVQGVVAALRGAGLLSGRDVFLYAVDENCQSGLGPAWRTALNASPDADVRRLLVGHTCSQDPATQPVDVPIVFASAYSPERTAAARQAGKKVWIYNGNLPQTGAFLTDGGALSLRVNGRIQARFGIQRWFYWESTFWNDDNHGGHGPYDPFTVAETFHNQYGDHANGDGVLVYPGVQVMAGERSLGMDGVVASVRLKQWRRGISDAGYLQLARAIDQKQADGIAATLVPQALAGAAAPPGGGPATWPARGAPYFQARRQLFDIIARGTGK